MLASYPGHGRWVDAESNVAVLLARIVLDRRHTESDGLHLSQAGHDRFAEWVRPWLALDRQ
jgi:lysophospholipase L1-like esterase